MFLSCFEFATSFFVVCAMHRDLFVYLFVIGSVFEFAVDIQLRPHCLFCPPVFTVVVVLSERAVCSEGVRYIGVGKPRVGGSLDSGLG